MNGIGERVVYIGVKDQGLLEYLADDERFADLINGTIFQGRKIIESQYLRDKQRKKRVLRKVKSDTHSDDSQNTQKINNSDTKIMYLERERDIFRLYDKPGERVYLACEGQTNADYEMPARNFCYDSIEYVSQLKHRKSVLKKRGRGVSRPLRPVFHQVLYLGESRWKSKHSLREMMNIPEKFKEFVDLLPDYKICLTDIHDQNPELFHTEWKDVFRLMNHSRKPEELREYIETHRQEVEKLSLETRLFLAILLEQYVYLDENVVEVKDVCRAWDGAMMLYKEDARIETIIDLSLDEGMEKNKVLDRLQKKCNLSLQQAEERYNNYVKIYRQ